MKRNFSDTSDDDLVVFFSAKGIPWPIGIKLQLAAYERSNGVFLKHRKRQEVIEGQKM